MHTLNNHTNNPTVSVVMPVYNVQDTLGLAIASVLQQSFQDYELILVDDGSTDNSSIICQIISLQDKRIRMIRQRNKGLAGARNTGIDNACGELIAFLDSDDLWHQDKLQQHVELLENNPKVGVSYSASQFIDASGKALGLFQQPKLSNISAKDVLLRNPVGNGSAPVIRREALADIAFKDEQGCNNYFDASLRQSEDIECWVRIITTTDWEFAGIDQALTCYRVNDGGLSANVEKQLASWETAIEKMRGYAPKLIQGQEKLAKANQYRYLARRAIRSGDAKNAMKYGSLSLKQAPSNLIRQPGRTASTLLAMLALNLLSTKHYQRIEHCAVAMLAKRNTHKPVDVLANTRHALG